MAGSTTELIVKLIGDTSSFKAAMGGSVSDIQGLEKRLASFGDSAQQLGKKLALGVTLPIAAIAAVGYKELAESQKVMAQTEAVLRSTGAEAGITARHVAELATSLSNMSGMDDEAIQSMENVLLTFREVRNEVGKGNDIFDQATGLILDMSVALGTDLQSSAIQVGKALNDPVVGMTALRRVGVSFTQSQVDMVKQLMSTGDLLGAQKIIVAELRAEFEGSAAAFGETMPGQIAKARVAFENMSGVLMASAAPAINAVAGGLTEMFKWIEAAPAPVKTFIDVFAGVAAIGGPALYVFGSLAKGLLAIRQLSPPASAALASVGKMIAGVGIAGAILGGAALAGNELAKALGQAANSMNLNVAAFQSLTHAEMAQVAALLQSKSMMGQFDEVVLKLAEDAPATAAALVAAADLPAAARDRLNAAIDRTAEAHKRSKVAAAADAAATDENAEAMDRAAFKAMNLAQQLQVVYDKTMANINAEMGLEGAHLNVSKQLSEYYATIKAGNATMREKEQATFDAEQAMLAAAVAAADQNKAEQELAGGTQTSTERTLVQIQELSNLRDTVGRESPLGIRLQQHIDELNAIRENVETRIYVTMFGEEAAERHMANLRAWDNVEINTRWNIFSGIYGYGPDYPGRPQLQHGGPIPGSTGMAIPVLAHGGEYVLSADVVSRIKAGRPSYGATVAGGSTLGGGGAPGGPIVVNLHLDGQVIGQTTVDYINRKATRGPGPLLSAATTG